MNLMSENVKILGTGFLCVDFIEHGARREVVPGGTAGNVITFLAQLGMDTSFLCADYEDDTWIWLKRALESRDIHLLYFTKSKKAVPKILEKLDVDGEHRFETSCPVCNKKWVDLVLPNESQINEKILYEISNLNLFYYDRISPGIRRMVDYNKKGWNFYEPNSCRFYGQFVENVRNTHILKFSQERIPEGYTERIIKDLQESQVQLIIVSLGKNGLKYSFRDSSRHLCDWIEVEACKVEKVVDNSGAGDWLTAVFLFYFLRYYPFFTKKLEGQRLKEILKIGNEIAAFQCGFVGAQGILKSQKAVSKLNDILGTNMHMLKDKKFENSMRCEKCGYEQKY